ncbi:MAG: hypothetical protein HOP06_03750 [Methylotenera sp.]|nr:hypothetical protein [Methylotenera sp.]
MQLTEVLLKAPRADKQIRINISRNTLIAFIISILLHALILAFITPILFDNASAPRQTIEVSLAPKPVVTPPAAMPNEPPQTKPEPKLKTQPKAPKVIAVKPKAEPPVFSVPDAPIPKPEPAPQPPKETPTTESAPTDMASYVKQQQAKRNAFEADAARQNAEAAAREIGPSAEQVRDERIKNNFKNGTNGIFEITSLSGRHAAFSFKGWTNDYSNARRESFEVEAATGQDVRLVMIKKMIVLIRKHYQGDFNWESQRLGRTVVQSARLEDNAGLEDFMMMEFFGANYKNAY